MLDELKEEGIVNKVGGRFKLSTLIQKRMVALNTGAKPLVDVSCLIEEIEHHLVLHPLTELVGVDVASEHLQAGLRVPQRDLARDGTRPTNSPASPGHGANGQSLC